MKLRHPWLIGVGAAFIAGAIRLLMVTVRCRVVNHDETNHPADAKRERYIYAFWHESLLVPVKFKTRVTVLVSKHADGELISQACGYLGYGTIRGSTTRGGGGALVDLFDCGKNSHLAFTPDGPRGPRRRVQLGIIILAARTGLPIIPAGVGFTRAWRMGSWDRFAIPKPFSACVGVIGKAIRVPAGVDRAGLEQYRLIVQERMLEATAEAERLAAGGPRWPRRLAGEGTALHGPHSRDRRRAELDRTVPD